MNSPESEITITPDPQVLQVLTYLEMHPINSLCELVDNSIDALATRRPELGSFVVVELPSRREVEDGTARVRVWDNGPGMTLEEVQNSLRAGYSNKPRHGSLGLFGVGFNIATGKLGRVTRVVTAREEDDHAIETFLDLVNLKRAGNFKVKAARIAKPDGFVHGTIVEVMQPWGPGSQNFGFMSKLVSIGRPKTLSLLGRIYATLLREKRVRILVGEDSVEPFHHCIWDDSRFVEHAKHGKIYAVSRFSNKVIHSYRECASCASILREGEVRCPQEGCGSNSTRTREERISGWVGIQRYLDASHFGIDLIRNGRAIRILEKEAFFVFQDAETGDPIVDYPTDNREGRIVGEIHLDHAPVDPAKQNFEHSSPEWRRAIEFLRGTSSLQPERPGADSNVSPVFRLYQGYRKVRTPGRRSMTMGKWLPGSNEPKSLSKDEIDSLRKKFDAHEPGYFDDAEWWKLVEQADQKPVPNLRKCPSCHLESPLGLEECPHCNHIFEGKDCINDDCRQLIGRSAVTCPHCGANQIPEVEEPWTCEVCSSANSSDHATCSVCSNVRGTANPVSRVGLQGRSHRDDSLSVAGLAVRLSSGALSSPIDVTTYLTDGPIFVHHTDGSKTQLPTVRFAETNIEIYMDPKHPLFEQAGVQLEQQVACETAAYLHLYYSSLSTKNPAEHSITKIGHEILQKYWPNRYSLSEVDDDLDSLFKSLRSRLVYAVEAESADVYANLSQEEKTALASELVRCGRDISELSQLKENGQFVLFLRPRGVMEVFRINPRLFFDGKVWNITYSGIPAIHPEGGERLQAQIRNEHGSLLEIAAVYAEKGAGDPRESDLAEAACKLLWAKLAE
jgi:hypothetical protein